MGRGGRSASSGDVLPDVGLPRTHRLVIADEAVAEWNELIAYIKRDSPKNAAAVYDAISRRLFELKEDPRTGHADPGAPPVPSGAIALLTKVKRIAIYYLFPLLHQRDEIVFVLSIRRGSRLPLEEPEYARRWLEEVAKIRPSGEGSGQG